MSMLIEISRKWLVDRRVADLDRILMLFGRVADSRDSDTWIYGGVGKAAGAGALKLPISHQ